MRAAKLELSASVHEGPRGSWVSLSAWAIESGKYGSVAVAHVRIPRGEEPQDAEELVAFLLANLGSVAYG